MVHLVVSSQSVLLRLESSDSQPNMRTKNIKNQSSKHLTTSTVKERESGLSDHFMKPWLDRKCLKPKNSLQNRKQSILLLFCKLGLERVCKNKFSLGTGYQIQLQFPVKGLLKVLASLAKWFTDTKDMDMILLKHQIFSYWRRLKIIIIVFEVTDVIPYSFMLGS